MNYLLDKKIKQRKFSRTVVLVLVLLILFYFRSGIFGGLSASGLFVFRPVIVVGNYLGGKFNGLSSYLASKNSLYLQNQDLQAQLAEDQAKMSNYNSVLEENNNLKETLGRKNSKTSMTLAAILAKPNQSPYDTLLIDAGMSAGVRLGDTVFALGNVPIGRVREVFGSSAKVVLFSNPGEKTEVVMGDPPRLGEAGKHVFMQLTGRGGGNFEMTVPAGLNVTKGSEAVLPGINSYLLATVETIISDPRDSFQKAILVSPVNVQELRFVEIEN